MTRPATGLFLSSLFVLTCFAPRALHAQTCVGDCDQDQRVSVSELIRCVRIALGEAAVDTCPECDSNGDNQVRISDLVTAVSHALCNCAACPTPRPTNTRPPTNTPTNTLPPTSTPTNTVARPTSTRPLPPTPAGCACDFNGNWNGTSTSTRDTCEPELSSDSFGLTLAHACNGPITEPAGFIGTPELIDGQCCLVFAFEIPEDDGGKSCNRGRVCQGLGGGDSFDGSLTWQFFENANASCNDSNFECEGAEDITATR